MSGDPSARDALASLDPARHSLEEILRALAPRVRGWVYRHVGPGADLDDATQEALIQIAHALSSFEGRAKLSTYAHRVAIRAALRYRQRRPRTTELTVVHDGRTPEELATHRESLRRLYAALDQLSPKLRVAYVLCEIERVSHVEAASIAEVDVEALKARLKRARARVREILADDPYLAPLFGGRDAND